MAKRLSIKDYTRFVDHWGEFLRVYRQERGQVIDETKSRIPKTTYDDVNQQVTWWQTEYQRSCKGKHDHPIHPIFEGAVAKVRAQMQDAKPSALYPENKWLWFSVLMKFAIHLDELHTNITPSKTDLILESIQEAIDDRIEDVSDLVDRAGSAASDVASFAGNAVNAVGKAGESLWSSVKIVTYVGLGVIGTAIVVPPVIRAVRSKPTQSTE
jgi:hypothetical protein